MAATAVFFSDYYKVSSTNGIPGPLEEIYRKAYGNMCCPCLSPLPFFFFSATSTDLALLLKGFQQDIPDFQHPKQSQMSESTSYCPAA